MSKIVIKKRVSFDFLGEEYKDSYVDFQRIPVSDFEAIQKEMEEVKKNKLSSFSVVLGVIKKYFISGKFINDDKLEDISAEDLEGLDAESVLRCFSLMTGQEIDPKAQAPLTSQSTMEPITTESSDSNTGS